MLRHYLKIAARSIIKDKAYSIVNIIGLSLAVACCFLLIFWVMFELSYENSYSNSDRIYRLINVENKNGKISRSVDFKNPLVNQLKENFPQIEAVCCIDMIELPFFKDGDSDRDGIMASYLETSMDFLKMFSFNYLEGSPENVKNDKDIIITKTTARKIFGEKSALGKHINYGTGIMQYTYTVVAVIDLPQNTQIKFDILYPTEKSASSNNNYLMFKRGVENASELSNQINVFLTKNSESKVKIELQALKDIHLYTPKDIMTNSKWEKYGNLNQIYLFSLSGILILIIALINYINTSISRALSRMKEVGVRKVTGASKTQLVLRFLSESFILSTISILVAILFVRFLFADFSEIMGNRILLIYNWQTILIAVSLCLFVSLLSGGYSAFYLSSLNPVLVLRGGSKSGTKEGLRNILLGLQLFLSIIILTCTVIIYKQINTVLNADTGVNRENVIVLESSLWYDSESFIERIKKENPNIIDATMASSPPYNASWGYAGVSWEGCNEGVKNMEFTQIWCDSHFANTFNLEIIDGEFIKPGLSWFNSSNDKSYDIVVNESFKKLMGVKNPIGTSVTYSLGLTGKIIGVVKDFNFKPLREKVSPLIISFNPECTSNMFIRTNGNDKQKTLQYILAKYKEMKPNYSNTPIIFHTVDEDYKKMYVAELRTAKILSIFAFISLILSLMGIISMVSFMIEKRTKEIAIRKINGARIYDIVLLFSKTLVKIAIVVSVFALPICYIIMHGWLENYVYRTVLSWWIFVLIPGLIMFLLLIVITIQVYFTALKNPVDSLRKD